VETRTAGSASGLGKRTESNPDTAPQVDSTPIHSRPHGRLDACDQKRPQPEPPPSRLDACDQKPPQPERSGRKLSGTRPKKSWLGESKREPVHLPAGLADGSWR
jgi:hypothetical protein